MHRIPIRWMMSLLVWCCLTGNASAVSLGKIEVASHLGEPFFAQVEVHLAEDESMDKVHAAIAGFSDYRILEIYREPFVATIQIIRKSDGSHVLELSSVRPVRVPFFNLVVKLSYERFTQFKKFPVFLELPKAVQPAAVARQAPVATVRAKGPEVLPVVLQPATEARPKKPEQQKSKPFEPFDGWARTSVYGPIVRGDMLSTVAQRLKIDDRYTMAQIVVALYEKNPDKFNAGNFNLLKKGAMLKVPTRAEIEKHAPAEASRIFRRHMSRWRELIKKPRYATEKRAQETRYSPRIRVGEKAEAEHQTATTVAAADRKAEEEDADASLATAADGASASVIPASAPLKEDQEHPVSQSLAASTEQAQVEPVAPQGDIAVEKTAATPAAQEIDRQLKGLELQLKQMQLQLAMLQEEKKRDAEMTQWILLGMAVLIVILLLALLIVLRRKPVAGDTMAVSPVSEAEAFADKVEAVPEEVLSSVAPASSETVSEAEEAVATPHTEPSGTKADKAPLPQPNKETTASPVVADVSNANIDHLADADVYLRYGMEDEAMKMVELALQADPHRVDAHIKKILILSFFAREEELKRSIAASMQAISEGERERFLAGLREMGLDDVLPAMASGDAAAGDKGTGLLQHDVPEDVADTDESSAMTGDLADEAEELLQSVDDVAMLNEEMPDSALVDTADNTDAPDVVTETPATEGEELAFDISGFDLGEVSVGSHLPRESGLVAEDEALNFDLDGLEEQQEEQQEEHPPVESRQEQPDADHVRKLDRLLDQLEKDDDDLQS